MAVGLGVLLLVFSEVSPSSGHSVTVDGTQVAAVGEIDPLRQGRAVAIPVRDDVPTLCIGDYLELYVFDDPFGPVPESFNDPVAARVLEVRRDSLVVTVAENQVGRVAAGIVSGQIVVAAA